MAKLSEIEKKLSEIKWCAQELCKLLDIPYPVEPNPNAVEELAGCLDKYFPEGTKIDVSKLLRELEEDDKW